jgi:hypothetical protein
MLSWLVSSAPYLNLALAADRLLNVVEPYVLRTVKADCPHRRHICKKYVKKAWKIIVRILCAIVGVVVQLILIELEMWYNQDQKPYGLFTFISSMARVQPLATFP